MCGIRSYMDVDHFQKLLIRSIWKWSCLYLLLLYTHQTLFFLKHTYDIWFWLFEFRQNAFNIFLSSQEIGFYGSFITVFFSSYSTRISQVDTTTTFIVIDNSPRNNMKYPKYSFLFSLHQIFYALSLHLISIFGHIKAKSLMSAYDWDIKQKVFV